jgi:5-formyltetrahydrofolate cyclo-ligase
MAERRTALSADARASAARAVAGKLLALPALRAARARAEAAGAEACLSGYVAVRGELDPLPALEAARAKGFRVALPRIDATQPRRLTFHVCTGPMDLGGGPFGLTEPLAHCPVVPVEEIDVVLVPGLAFDAAGWRLGMGGGYYDDVGRRLREGRPEALMVGVGYDFQVVDTCPADGDAGDVPVDFVVTEARVLAAGAPS